MLQFYAILLQNVLVLQNVETQSIGAQSMRCKVWGVQSMGAQSVGHKE